MTQSRGISYVLADERSVEVRMAAMVRMVLKVIGYVWLDGFVCVYFI